MYAMSLTLLQLNCGRTTIVLQDIGQHARPLYLFRHDAETLGGQWLHQRLC